MGVPKGTALQAWLNFAICEYSATHRLKFSALLRRRALVFLDRCAVLAGLLLLLLLSYASLCWRPPLGAKRSASRARWDPGISSGRLLSGGCEGQSFAPPGVTTPCPAMSKEQK